MKNNALGWARIDRTGGGPCDDMGVNGVIVGPSWEAETVKKLAGRVWVASKPRCRGKAGRVRTARYNGKATRGGVPGSGNPAPPPFYCE